MLIVKEKTDPSPKFIKEAPIVGKPWEEGDPVGDCIAGYAKGPKNSYTRELAKKYPLRGQ